MRNVYDAPEYATVRDSLMCILTEVQEQYADTDPCEKEKVLFKGDRRYMNRQQH